MNRHTGPRSPVRAQTLAGLVLLGLLTCTMVLTGAGVASAAGSRSTSAATARSLPRAANPQQADQVRVEIDEVTPTALTSTGILHVRGMITNAGTTPLTGVYLRLRYRYAALTSRADLPRWASGEIAQAEPPNELRLTRRLVTNGLPARGGVPFELSAPASELGLPGTAEAFGTRGLMVDVIADVPGSAPRQVGAAYTFVVWEPVPTQRPTRLTMLAPVTSTLPQGDASEPTAALLASMTPTGRLNRLAATVQDTGISWAIDPALLSAARRARDPGGRPGPSPSPSRVTASPTTVAPNNSPGTTSTGTNTTGAQIGIVAGPKPRTSATIPPTATPAATPAVELSPTALASAAAGWLTSMTRTAATNPPLVLPFGDPDLAALARGGGASLLTMARQQADLATQQAFGASPRSSVAWPADGRADADTVGMLTGASWQGVVLAAGTQPPASTPSVTPSGRSTVSRPGTPLAGLLADDELSRQMARLGSAGVTHSQATMIQQRLLAELATITAERTTERTTQRTSERTTQRTTEHTTESRHLLVTAPRTWDPDPVTVGRVMTTLRQTPWVQLQSLDVLLAQAPTTARRPGLVYPPQAQAAELPRADVEWVVHQEESLARFSPVLNAPDRVLPDLQRRMVSLTGVAWRGQHEAELIKARAPLQAKLSATVNAISVQRGSDATLLSHSGNLVLTVRNELDQSVRVLLVLRPGSGMLRVGNRKAFTIGAGGNRTIKIPFQAAGNGQVRIDTTLWADPKGDQPIAEGPSLLVRVHSNWESIGLSIAGGLLGLLVLVGLVRSIRRGRNPLPPESAPDPDEVLVREEGERPLAAGLRLLRGRRPDPKDDAVTSAGEEVL